MKVTWLGQAGLLFETGGMKIICDPYLSDSVEKIEPHNKRRVPVDKKFLETEPDIILLTHCHLDHTDPETLCHYLKKDSGICVLAPENAWKIARQIAPGNNYVTFNRHTEWTQSGIRFKAVKAEHSDNSAVGIIMEAENKKYYITGDTLYSTEIFPDLPDDIDYVFLPVNGVGNNMNFVDAKRFMERVGGKAIPLHCGLFDSLDMNGFEYENKAVPEFYREIRL